MVDKPLGQLELPIRVKHVTVLSRAAQHWGQLLMFEGKSCSHGRAFTNTMIQDEVR
jgi:hypothetical protein